MKEFLMIFRNERQSGGAAPSAEQMHAVLKQWKNWISNLVAKGKYSSTNRLYPEGKTIRPNDIVTDGPYTEGKEIVGGYLIVKANTLDEAIELAKSCPILNYGGNVEVRSVMPIDPDPKSGRFLEDFKQESIAAN